MRDFGRLFASAAASQAGTQISYVAIPMVAVIELDASPGEVGLLGMLATGAFLLIGLPAGAWVDGLRRRPVLVAADLLRALVLGSIPVAWVFGRLTIEHLFVAVFLTGVCTVFFDIAVQSYLPHLVGRDGLMAANARLVALGATNTIAGRSAGGFLVQWLTAPVAIVVDAVSYLVSAAFLSRINQIEHGPDRSARRSVRAGLVFVVRHPVLRAVALAGATSNLFIQVGMTMLPLLFQRELGFSAGTLGLYLAVGGVGVLLGSVAARRLAARFGQSRVVVLTGLATVPAGLLVPLVDRGPMLWVAAAGWLVCMAKVGADNVILVSFRQQVTPDGLLGRMNATMRFVLTGALALGAALAGLLGELVGVRATVWVAAIGLSLSWLPMLKVALGRSGATFSITSTHETSATQ